MWEGKKERVLGGGHRTGLSLSSEDLRLDQWFSISSSRSPVVSENPPRDHSGIGTKKLLVLVLEQHSFYGIFS